MSKKIRCPYCGYRFEESGWSKAGRYGVYTLEAAVKVGTQLLISSLTGNRSPQTQIIAGEAGKKVTGSTDEWTWGDLECPKCKKNLGNP